jgi:hypothetical protein
MPKSHRAYLFVLAHASLTVSTNLPASVISWCHTICSQNADTPDTALLILTEFNDPIQLQLITVIRNSGDVPLTNVRFAPPFFPGQVPVALLAVGGAEQFTTSVQSLDAGTYRASTVVTAAFGNTTVSARDDAWIRELRPPRIGVKLLIMRPDTGDFVVRGVWARARVSIAHHHV